MNVAMSAVSRIFIIFQWVCFSTQAIVMGAIPDIPDEIAIQIKRTDHIKSKLIDMDADDIEITVEKSDAQFAIDFYPHQRQIALASKVERRNESYAATELEEASGSSVPSTIRPDDSMKINI
jgi:hypothetical protein